MTGKNKTALNERLIACVKKNEYEEVERCLKRKADVTYECNLPLIQKTTKRNGQHSSGLAVLALRKS